VYSSLSWVVAEYNLGVSVVLIMFFWRIDARTTAYSSWEHSSKFTILWSQLNRKNIDSLLGFILIRHVTKKFVAEINKRKVAHGM